MFSSKKGKLAFAIEPVFPNKLIPQQYGVHGEITIANGSNRTRMTV
jgi:hypothetical protein